MFTEQPKKMLIINILDILKKHTDENHRLSQKDIIDILKNEYNMTADRKAVKRNIMNLIDYGYDIEYSEVTRMTHSPKTGEAQENSILTDFYLNREFTDSELRLLIDSLLFSKHIPNSQCRNLINKLEGLSNKYFHSRARNFRNVPDCIPKNGQLFYTIEILDEAISGSKQVSFIYNEYGIDKKIHPRLGADGKPREYIINPYQIATTNGRYYLICSNNKYDNISNYRLDRITDIKLLSTSNKAAEIKGLENGLDLPKHMAEHIYMFSGESDMVTFEFQRHLLSDVIDWFGNEIDLYEPTDETVKARVKVNLQAMRKWALQYALYVKILSPESLVNSVKEDVINAYKNYGLS